MLSLPIPPSPMASYQKDGIENLLWPMGVGLWPYLEGKENKKMEKVKCYNRGLIISYLT